MQEDVPSDASQRIVEKELHFFLDISSHPDKLQSYVQQYTSLERLSNTYTPPSVTTENRNYG